MRPGTRPRRKSNSWLVPLEEGKDLATVRSSDLSRNHQVTGEPGEEGERMRKKTSDIWL